MFTLFQRASGPSEQWTTLGRIALILAVLWATLGVSAAQAAPLVTVRLTIEKITALDDLEDVVGTGDADFYAYPNVAGNQFSNEDTPDAEAKEDDDEIYPNWEFSQQVDSAVGSAAISIEIRDEDDFLRGEDDHVDINPNSGRNLSLTVDLASCAISGDVSGSCGTSITTEGDADDAAEFRFRVDVGAGPSAPNLRVQCTHSPLWPQPTDTITVSATPLNGALNTIYADSVEIWINGGNEPAATESTSLGATFAAGPFPAGSTFSYGCKIRHGGDEVWSGWRSVSIGNPSEGVVVPVGSTGPRASRIDIVFIPEKDHYTGASDPQFLSDVSTVINAYLSEDIFLSNQDKLNFWLATDMGDARTDCPDSTAPDNWDDDYTFADVGAIVHRSSGLRDCAFGDRAFTGDATRMDAGLLGRVFLHETGHRPFGLADEYCRVDANGDVICDGGYFQNDEFPNVYEEPEDCEVDIPNLTAWDLSLGLAPRTESSCREFEETIDWWPDTDWSVSDPSATDLMVDNLTAQGADLRRMTWLFDQCRAAGC